MLAMRSMHFMKAVGLYQHDVFFIYHKLCMTDTIHTQYPYTYSPDSWCFVLGSAFSVSINCAVLYY